MKSLRTIALVTLLAGAAGSLGLLLRAGQSAPRLLLVIMAVWVLSPFVLMVLADAAAKRWAFITPAALCIAALIVTFGSLAAYIVDAVWHPWEKPAAVYVTVPPLSWLVIAVVVTTAALISRRRDAEKISHELHK